jgi:hypothetical protein
MDQHQNVFGNLNSNFNQNKIQKTNENESNQKKRNILGDVKSDRTNDLFQSNEKLFSNQDLYSVGFNDQSS